MDSDQMVIVVGSLALLGLTTEVVDNCPRLNLVDIGLDALCSVSVGDFSVGKLNLVSPEEGSACAAEQEHCSLGWTDSLPNLASLESFACAVVLEHCNFGWTNSGPD